MFVDNTFSATFHQKLSYHFVGFDTSVTRLLTFHLCHLRLLSSLVQNIAAPMHDMQVALVLYTDQETLHNSFLIFFIRKHHRATIHHLKCSFPG